MEATNAENYEEFVKMKNGSCKLVRWNMDNEELLCMLITDRTHRCRKIEDKIKETTFAPKTEI